MTIKVIGDKPIITRKITCENCGYELEFNNIDTVDHRTDSDGDPIEARGRYLVCPRPGCHHRNLVDRRG
jgi:hypothetical protein